MPPISTADALVVVRLLVATGAESGVIEVVASCAPAGAPASPRRIDTATGVSDA
jgi:hypothetical protein